MTPERHQQICNVLYQVLELPSEQRGPFLEQACASDGDLRRELDSLLSGSDEMRTGFLRLSTVRLLGPGTRLDDFEIEALIGSGGMGEVYRARDLQLPREVAIKVISSYLSVDQKQLRRFEQEARAAAATNHPNILTVIRMGTHQGAPYLVSELLEGETLRAKLKQGRIPLPQVIELATQVVRGLAAAHEKGIVHRDLKPENLFVTKDGRIKILDFGLAKLTQSLTLAATPGGLPHESIVLSEPGIIMGTPGYMSPEQARGQSTDTRSDIFSFGAVLYEMITGKRAFEGETPADSISSILSQQPPALTKTVRNAPAALQRVIDRCLEKQPERRYQDASELVTALQCLPKGPVVPLPKILAFASVLLVFAIGYSFRSSLVNWVHHIYQPSRAATIPDNLAERNLTANPAENPVRAAAISRDGKYVAYIDNADKVSLLLVTSGDVRPLSLDSSYEPVAWFPDGVHLLVARRSGQPGLWKFSTWDSSLHKLWDGAVGTVSISPDGSTIAFVNGDSLTEIWSIGAQGEAPRKVAGSDPKDSFYGVAWAPDGRRLAYLRLRGTYDKHESTIETCDLSGGARAQILSEPQLFGNEGVQEIAWLADGRIVYSLWTRLTEYNLWSVPVSADGRSASGKPQAITNWKDFIASSFQATADGKHMIVLKDHSEDSVYIGPLAGKPHTFKPKRLTVDQWRNVGTSWTTDSKAILLYSQRNGRYTIREQQIDGNQAETLVDGPDNYREPIASSTGMLVYNSYLARNGVVDPASYRVLSTPLTGGPKVVLLTGRYSYACGTAPLSPCVVAQLQPDNQLVFFALDPAKGKGQKLATVTNYNAQNARWCLSPAGDRVAIADASVASDSIRVLDLQGGKITERPVHKAKSQSISSVAWAADSKRLFVITRTDASTALASVGAGYTLTTLYELPSQRAFLSWPLVSPDGRFLAFSQRTYVSDLVLLENF